MSCGEQQLDQPVVEAEAVGIDLAPTVGQTRGHEIEKR